MPWKRTDKWRPCRPQTNSTASGGGGFESDDGKLGYAKAVSPHKEKIASDLAALVGVPVPQVWIDKVEGRPEYHAISSVFGSESIDAALLESRLGARYKSPEIQDAFRRASGLLPFHAWLATEDLKNEHLVVSPTGNSYDAAAIDFAFSLKFPADGGDISAPTGPPALVANVDQNVIRQAVERIEATTDEQIRQIIDALPDEAVGRAEKDTLISGLSARRGKIREAMKQKGWLT